MSQKIIPIIRRASPGDADLLAALGARTFYDSFASDNKAESIASYLAESFGPEIQAAELADPSVTLFVAEHDEIAIGYAQLRVEATPDCVSGLNPIHLVRIYVTRDWIGHGVGEALLNTCIEEAKTSGRRIMWLGVWKKNLRAQTFYRKHDFRIVGERVFRLGADNQVDWIMERTLQ